MIPRFFTSASTPTKIAVVVLATVGMSGGAYAAIAGQAAKPSVPTPTISAKPANPTSATTAAFSFTDTQTGVTFQCALDSQPFASCTSPKSYSGLGEGTHTFSVRAQDSNGKTSSAASYGWTIDRTPPPAPTLTAQPADPTNQTSASLSFMDSEGGVGFVCQLDGGPFAACTSPKAYTGLTAARHTFAVKAIDAVGLSSAVSSYAWSVDVTPPPAPVLDSAPTNPTSVDSATFGFSDAEAGVSFRCKLDTGSQTACNSPKTYNNLAVGAHTFQVQAVDRAGNVSAATSHSWTVATPVSGFGLSGDLAGALYPGGSAPLDVKITNPFSFDIDVSGLIVTPKQATTKNGQPNPGCDGSVNLTVAQYSGGGITVRRNSTVSLSDLHINQAAWPQLRMPNLGTNQDACKGTSFAFTYSATATKK